MNQHDEFIDQILDTWPRGRSRQQIYAELCTDDLIRGWKIRALYVWMKLFSWFAREKTVLRILFRSSYSGHSRLLDPVITYMQSALLMESKQQKMHASIMLSEYRTHLYLISSIQAPEGLGDAVSTLIVDAYDSQLDMKRKVMLSELEALVASR